MDKRRITFFAHHQGQGHARRVMAIADAMAADRPVSVLTAGPDLFAGFADRAEIVALPDMIGARCATPRLFAENTPDGLHCVPLGVAPMRRTMRLILDHLDDAVPGLFVVDVSSEIALMARIASTPTVQIRMHGDRIDAGHTTSYEASVGMLAPFDERLEQDDYPARLRAKTFYTGGLCTAALGAAPDREAVRRRLGIDPGREVILVLTGGGGAGTPYAPLTVGARAAPDAVWLVAGPTRREGHETDFANLLELGWVDGVADYLAAADIVVASAGDNTVHEVARAGKPYLVMPEWRYFGEQVRKAEALERLGAAVAAPTWPSDNETWRALLARTRALSPAVLAGLHDPAATAKAATYLEGLADELWASAPG